MPYDAVEHTRQIDSQCYGYSEAVDPSDILVDALKAIAERDPQADFCGKGAPENCSCKCLGCMARTALRKVGEL